jgi:hypothetical protein
MAARLSDLMHGFVSPLVVIRLIKKLYTCLERDCHHLYKIPLLSSL